MSKQVSYGTVLYQIQMMYISPRQMYGDKIAEKGNNLLIKIVIENKAYDFEVNENTFDEIDVVKRYLPAYLKECAVKAIDMHKAYLDLKKRLTDKEKDWLKAFHYRRALL